MSIAVVDSESCMGCGLCEDLCPYEGAVTLKDRKSRINESSCRGCGLCVGACPGLALDLKYLPRRQVMARVRALLRSTRARPVFEPRVMVFICDWLSRKGASLSDLTRIPGSSNVRATKLPCIGSMDPLFIVNAFLSGADGILVAGCGANDCDNVDSNLKAASRIEYVLAWLRSLGIESERLRFELIPLSTARSEFAKIAAETITAIKDIGPMVLGEQR